MSRACDGCSLCCKVVRIKEFDKPAGSWCRHCSTQKGCDIHATRPDICRGFFCGWLSFEDLGDEWKPERSKLVLAIQEQDRVTIHVDPDHPGAWKQEPFYSKIKNWAQTQNKKIVVSIAEHIHMIFPDRDVDLGPMRDDQLIKTWQTPTPDGVRFGAELVEKK